MSTVAKGVVDASVQRATACEIVAMHFKGQDRAAEQRVSMPKGIMPSGMIVVCGECSDEGGGSSGQCACR